MAQTSIRINGPASPFAFETLTVTNAVKQVTTATAFPRLIAGSNSNESIDRGAEEAFFTIEADQVRYTLDGTTPTAAIGHLLEVGDTLWLVGRNMIRNLKMIRVTTDSTVRVTYFRVM